LSGLAPLIGHEQEAGVLARAVARDELPAALLILGAPGIGKQRMALWLGQLLLCEDRRDDRPCGTCKPCRMAIRLEHPDLHWFFPLPRPKVSGGPDRLADALEEARASELEARRKDPWYASGNTELVGIYLAHAQVIRRVANARPSMARRKIIIIGDAENLVPQEASPEAANALLKLLEEPPPDTVVIVTSSDGEALLPTIRSRLTHIRLRSLQDSQVADVLVRARAIDPERAAIIARLSGGSIGRALAFAGDSGSDGPLEGARQEAREWLAAACESRPGRRFIAVSSQAPAGARGGFATSLQFLIVWLRDLAAVAAGADDAVINRDAADWLQRVAAQLPYAGAGAGVAIQDVEHVLQLTQNNINPQLALNSLLRVIGSRLRGEPASSGGLAIAGSLT
jgi:DNA polymerase-3 subunit delta'